MLIAQISDLHIVEKGAEWLSQPTTEIKERLIKTIATLNELTPRPDVVLLTGDATEDGKAQSYAHLMELLALLEIPLFVVPGNHDRREAMREAFKDTSFMPSSGFIQYAIDEYPVRLIGLDTLEEGKDFGHLCETRLSWLEKTLEQDREKPTLIFMHHPPV